MPPDIAISEATQLPGRLRPMEYVERKGLGHPDTICDSVMEAASQALGKEYLRVAGRILHHNLDKGLLVAGQSMPALGGGRVQAPMRLIFGDRATDTYEGVRIPVGEIVEAAAREWIGSHLRFVDPRKHVVYQNEIRPGSPELTDIFARARLTANDTSAAVGYAPLSETELLVLSAEEYLNSPVIKHRFPAAGEDVKVMGVRHGDQLFLTVAVAFVDRFVSDPQTYCDTKEALRQDLEMFVRGRLTTLGEVVTQLNMLDDPGRGESGMYLTVLGTSAEGADGGEVGRGNRVNGLISFNRPMSLEAAAGKNPVSHVGKIYNLFCHELASRIWSLVDGVDEVTVWMCSQIGRPLNEPWSIDVAVSLAPGMSLPDVAVAIQDVGQHELQGMESFVQRVCRGEFRVC